MKMIVQLAIASICGFIVGKATSNDGLAFVTALVVGLQINVIVSLGEIRSKLR